MKKFLSILLVSIGLFASKGNAQSFSVFADTMYGYNYTGASIFDTITNLTANPLILKWKVIGTNLPADWLPGLGICDNVNCRTNPAGQLWDGTSGPVQTSAGYLPGVPGDFHISSTPGTTNGTFFVTINIYDPAIGGTSHTITYILTKGVTAIANVQHAQDDVVLYPNPASSNVNVLFNADAGIKTISVHNVIGKMMSIYKVSGNSAQLSLDNIPAGIYFVRLQDAQGGVIATRRFTRQ